MSTKVSNIIAATVAVVAGASVALLYFRDHLHCRDKRCIRPRWHLAPHRDKYGREWVGDAMTRDDP